MMDQRANAIRIEIAESWRRRQRLRAIEALPEGTAREAIQAAADAADEPAPVMVEGESLGDYAARLETPPDMLARIESQVDELLAQQVYDHENPDAYEDGPGDDDDDPDDDDPVPLAAEDEPTITTAAPPAVVTLERLGQVCPRLGQHTYTRLGRDSTIERLAFNVDDAHAIDLAQQCGVWPVDAPGEDSLVRELGIVAWSARVPMRADPGIPRGCAVVDARDPRRGRGSIFVARVYGSVLAEDLFASGGASLPAWAHQWEIERARAGVLGAPRLDELEAFAGLHVEGIDPTDTVARVWVREVKDTLEEISSDHPHYRLVSLLEDARSLKIQRIADAERVPSHCAVVEFHSGAYAVIDWRPPCETVLGWRDTLPTWIVGWWAKHLRPSPGPLAPIACRCVCERQISVGYVKPPAFEVGLVQPKAHEPPVGGEFLRCGRCKQPWVATLGTDGPYCQGCVGRMARAEEARGPVAHAQDANAQVGGIAADPPHAASAWAGGGPPPGFGDS